MDELAQRVLEVEDVLRQYRLRVRANEVGRKNPRFGTPIQVPGPPPIKMDSDFGNRLSDAARKDIEAIEHNYKTAIHRIGHILIN